MSDDPIIKHLHDVLDYKWSGTGLIPSEVRSILDALAAKDKALSEMRAELEAIKAERDTWRRVAERLENEKQAARKALEPFKEIVKTEIRDEETDNTKIPVRIGFVRAAARALAPSIQDEGGER